MKRLSGILLCVCVCLPLNAGEPSTLSLSEALSLAMAHNREMLAAGCLTESAASSEKSSYGKFLPQIAVEGKYTRLDDPITIDLNEIRTAMISADIATVRAGGVTNPAVLAGLRAQLEAGIPSFVDQVQRNEYSNLSATLVQPVFTGGKIYANTQAKHEEYTISLLQQTTTRNKVITDVVSSYCRMQFMRELVAIKQAVVNGISEHQLNAQKLMDEGMISKAAKMRADVALADAAREYAKAKRDQELAGVLLANALGIEVSSRTLSTPLFLGAAGDDQTNYLTRGPDANPTLQTILHRQQMLKHKLTAARANFLPAVSLFGKYELYKNDLTMLEPQWAAGAVARLGVFNGGSDVFDVRAAKQEAAALAYAAQRARELVTTEIRKWHIDMIAAQEQHDALITARALAEENLRLNKLSFAEGVASSLDVIDAELALAKVRAEQSKALFDYDVALVNMLAASGNAQTILQYIK